MNTVVVVTGSKGDGGATVMVVTMVKEAVVYLALLNMQALDAPAFQDDKKDGGGH
ncbi:hypothetical protein M8C21_012336 [Ambrosia artemisiifolia]|uniref:Uncharacterized protein n=1 Tax=Ambrosia artemisiifolia TaxID=4212 RepID=A0AAD5GSC4_AMBAR|nr:hypothetical protein M8C21_012336 [Ambrosia artemisiifolia]